MTPLVFVAGGAVWLFVIVLAVALCRAAALGDEQAESATVVDLDDFRHDWGAA